MEDLKHKENIRLVLASKSPRRQKLIKDLGFPFRIVEIDVEEIYPESLSVFQVPEFLAKLKANHYNDFEANEILITADTIVILDHQIIGKPENLQHAKKVLQSLSGKMHQVITGVCLKSKDKEVTFSSKTDVHFHQISKEEIDYYLNNFKVLDKAGSYAIQDWIGKIAVKHIEGDYYNIVGLPIAELYQKLKNFV